MPSNTQPGPTPNWADYRDVLEPVFVGYVAYECNAVGLRAYQPHIVHGLLQTKEYTQSLARTVEEPDTPPETIARQLDVRLARQQTILDRDGGLLHFVLDESVLLRPTEPGETGAQILRDQARRLVELDSHPRITIQILPLRSGVQRGMRDSFTLLEPQQPFLHRYLLYRERSEGSRTITNPHEVGNYASWFEGLTAAAIGLKENLGNGGRVH